MNALKRVGAAVVEQYRSGLGLFVAVPIAVALAIVPEFIQHVVEIRLGMFDSRAAARALSNDPTRWAFGYVKLTGFALAILACARAVYSRRHGGTWWSLRDVAWGRLLVGLALWLLIGSLAAPFTGRIDRVAQLVINIVLSIASVPFLFVALAGLFGDRATAWRALLARCWPAVALLVVLMLTGFALLQALHTGNHLLALGRPAAIVWALMTWDSLVVGLLAATTGAGFALSYDLARERASA